MTRLMIPAMLLTLWVPVRAWSVEVQVQGGAGVGALSGAAVSSVVAGVHVEAGSLEARWLAPLRSDLRSGSLRRQDWDERGEWTRLLPSLVWARPRGDGRLPAISLRLGPTQSATLGHGSVVRGYRSTPLVDHFRTAFAMDVDADTVGGQLIASDLALGRMVAARLFVRPLLERATGPAGLTVGLSAVTDRSAPVGYLRDAGGAKLAQRSGLPETRNAGLVVVGLDISAPIALGPQHDVAPYADLNLATLDGGGGYGAHLGAWWRRRQGGLTLQVRWELRLSHGAYRPGWFDAFYEIERFQVDGSQTKAGSWLARDRASQVGQMLEASAGTPAGWRAGFCWEGWHTSTARPSDTLSTWLKSPSWRGLRTQARWDVRPGRGQHALALATLWQGQSPLFASAKFERTWRAQAGSLEPVHNLMVDLGARWRW